MANPTDPNAAIAQRVKAAMKDKRLTHPEVAVQVGLSERTFDRFLTGNFDWKVSLVVKIEDALDVPILSQVSR